MIVNIQKGTVNMKSYFTSIRIIIVLSMIVSVSFGTDQLEEVITEEQSNIVYRNNIDFNTNLTRPLFVLLFPKCCG